ncbi:MAG: flagellar hook-associated protein 3 [Dehalococcoidia bacterium]|nr:MAG: flagellar hook-associated protein 3 [Dehalococcoidia bacterium]
MLRITNAGNTSRLMQHIQAAQARLARTQDRMASGRRINRPSDDPFGNSRVMTMRTGLGLVTQRQRTVELAKSELGVTEAALESLGRVLARAEELAVQADSTAVDARGRAAIATEVDSLLQEAATVGNASYGGRHLFGGFQTASPPFMLDTPSDATAVTFSGDAGTVTREIGDGETVEVSLDGQALFGGVFTSLIGFRDALRAGDRTGIRAGSTALKGDIDRMLAARGEIGARVRRVELVEERLAGDEANLQTQVSQLEDADLTQEAVDLQLRDVALQAALSATAKSLTDSLLEFLR